jgi:sulfur carrier protein ThiS adenylyltransferase
LIEINGRKIAFNGQVSIGELRDQYYPGANLLIYDGFPVNDLAFIPRDGCELVFIQKGAIVSAEELELLMQSRHTPGIASKLKGSMVGIAGLGGLGSNIAVALSRIGIGQLILCDFDLVEPSNLNRQQYLMSHLGMPKALACKDLLMQINPYLNYTAHVTKVTPGNFLALFGQCQIILEAFDQAEAKAMLIREAARAGKTLIAASGMAGYGDNESIITRKINDRLYIIGDFVNEAKPGMGLMAPRVMIAAAKQANLAVELLLNNINSVEKQ